MLKMPDGIKVLLNGSEYGKCIVEDDKDPFSTAHRAVSEKEGLSVIPRYLRTETDPCGRYV